MSKPARYILLGILTAFVALTLFSIPVFADDLEVAAIRGMKYDSSARVQRYTRLQLVEDGS